MYNLLLVVRHFNIHTVENVDVKVEKKKIYVGDICAEKTVHGLKTILTRN